MSESETSSEVHFKTLAWAYTRKNPSMFYLGGRISGAEFNQVIHQLTVAGEGFSGMKLALILSCLGGFNLGFGLMVGKTVMLFIALVLIPGALFFWFQVARKHSRAFEQKLVLINAEFAARGIRFDLPKGTFEIVRASIQNADGYAPPQAYSYSQPTIVPGNANIYN